MAKRPGMILIDGAALRRAREAQELTRDALSAMLGATPEEYETMGRAIFRMEKSGKASRAFAEQVCKALSVSLGDIRLDGFVRVRNPKGFDLRSLKPPTFDSDGTPSKERCAWLESRPAITLSELSLTASDKPCTIESCHLTCSLFPDMPFAWLYKVTLNPSASTWLGDPQDLSRLDLDAGSAWSGEVMFCAPLGAEITWRNTLGRIRAATGDIDVSVTLKNTLGESLERHYAMDISGLDANETASKRAGYPEPPVVQLYEKNWRR